MERIDECISFLAGKAAQAVSRLARERLEPFGITPVQYAVLQALWEADGQSGAEIGSRRMLDSAKLTGVLHRLESARLIRREAHAHDRRINRIRLTTAGQGRRQALQTAMDGLNAEVAQALARRPTSSGGCSGNSRANPWRCGKADVPQQDRARGPRRPAVRAEAERD